MVTEESDCCREEAVIFFIVFFVVILQIGGRSETMFQHNTNQVKEEDSKQIHKQNEVVFELASGTTITEV